MKRKNLLSASLILVPFLSFAQVPKKTYAITGKQNNTFLWADIKQVDVASGKVVKTLFESDKTVFKSSNPELSAKPSQAEIKPTGFGVAACALDSRDNRLYFAPMHFADIRYLDLNKDDAEFTTIKNNVIAAPPKGGYLAEEDQITRMVFSADGYGYALTNDANHLIRFTTGKRPVVEDLGNLLDAESNSGISVHNKCSSWGGDMVADAFGKLVLVSAGHNVFTIDANTRVATFKGTITGLPANFTTNGAAVDEDGNMIVSSANVFDGLFSVNYKDLKAVKIPGTENSFNASDLANGNFLLQKEYDALTKYNINPVTFPGGGYGSARVYPNPVTGNQFNVSFQGQSAGRYTILFTDISGRTIFSKPVTVAQGGQVETVRIAKKMSQGLFMIKVLDEKRQQAFSEKIVIF